VIYCVIPPEWVDELYDKMVARYADNPDVTVIIDRRGGPDRRNASSGAGPHLRELRDRRRQRVVGTFPAMGGQDGQDGQDG
jgi:hypothetical protein